MRLFSSKGLVAARVARAIGTSALLDPVKHIFMFSKSFNTPFPIKAMVKVVNHELPKGRFRRLPDTHVVVRPVSVMNIHFSKHVVGKVAHIHTRGHIGVGLIIRAKIICSGRVQHVNIFIRNTVARFNIFAQMLEEGNRRGIDSIIRFYKVLVKTFTHIVNAIVRSVVEHHHLTATLVVHTTPFKDCATHSIGKVVTHKTVTIVTQVKALVLVILAPGGFEQRIMQPGSAIFLAHHDGNRLLTFHAAPTTHQ